MTLDARPARRLALVVLVAGALLVPSVVLAEAALPDARIVAMRVASGPWLPPGSPPPPPRTVTIVLENAGGSVLPDTIVEFGVIRADGYRDVLTGFESFPLASGERATFRAEWAPPPDRFGDFDLVATADPYSAIAERNEYDNAAHARGTYAPASGLAYPSRSFAEDVGPRGAVTLGDEWARYALDRHDADNPAPGLLLDRAGYGRDGEIHGVTPARVPGVVDDARRFDGSTRVTTPFPQSPAGWSVAFWVLADGSPNAGGTLWADGATDCARSALSLGAEGTLALHVPTAEGACSSRHEAAAGAAPGAWTHVVLSGTPAATAVIVDGDLVLVVPRGVAPGAGVIGDALTGVTLDDVRVYARPVTPAEAFLLVTGKP